MEIGRSVGEKIWDDILKLLVKADPQSFVSFVVAGAKFAGERDKELQTRTIDADLLYNVIWKQEEIVPHVEFQRRRDKHMGRRVWEYNVLTGCLTGIPVYLVVLYLIKEKNVIESPYGQRLADGEIIHSFHFQNIKLWEIPSSFLRQPGMEGMLPLLPLTDGGAQREVVEEMIADLSTAGKKDLFPLSYALAALVLKSSEDKLWLAERFSLMHDILEESWAYQEMVQKGRLEGIEKGRLEGKLEGKREIIWRYIQKRFPGLLELAQQRVNQVNTSKELSDLVDAVFDASNEAEVMELLKM